jgi:hypothetical protein
LNEKVKTLSAEYEEHEVAANGTRAATGVTQHRLIISFGNNFILILYINVLCEKIFILQNKLI